MADQELSVEERLARALNHPKMAGGSLVRVALAEAGLALYDPATHVAVSRKTADFLLTHLTNWGGAAVVAHAANFGGSEEVPMPDTPSAEARRCHHKVLVSTPQKWGECADCDAVMAESMED